MNQPNNRDYYVSRAASARNLAQRAEDPSIAAIHAEFAHRYDQLAAEPNQHNDNEPAAVQPT